MRKIKDWFEELTDGQTVALLVCAIVVAIVVIFIPLAMVDHRHWTAVCAPDQYVEIGRANACQRPDGVLYLPKK